ncbi:MAG: tetraacyldisaccharide 4'-kinase [bacterium]
MKNKLLAGLSGLYFVAYQIDKMYKLLQMKKLNTPLISIGNVEMGGTGKTQLTCWLVEKLIEKNKKIAVLSRGYRGKYRGIVSPSTSSAGDEILMMAKYFSNYLDQVVFYADPKRLRAAGKLFQLGFSPDLYILDDGFQHYCLYRNLDIVLIDAKNPRGGGLFPAGRLREPFSKINRADLILFTRCQSEQNRDECLNIIKPYLQKKLKVLFSEFILDKIIYQGQKLDGNYSYFLATAIGKPMQLMNQLKSSGLNIAGSRFFRDHHNFSKKEILEIKKEAERLKCNYVLMTEKDQVKVDFPVAVCHSSIKFFHEDEHILIEEVLNCLN